MRVTANTLGLFLVVAGEPLLEILADGTGVNEQNRPTGFANAGQLTDAEKAAFEYALNRYYSGQEAADAMKANLPFWTKQPREATDTPEITAYKDACDMRNATDAEAFDRVLTSGKYDTPATEVSVVAAKPVDATKEPEAASQSTPPAAPAAAPTPIAQTPAPDAAKELEAPPAAAQTPTTPVPTMPVVNGAHVSDEVAAADAAKTAAEHPATSRIVELVTIVEKDLTGFGHWALVELKALAHKL